MFYIILGLRQAVKGGAQDKEEIAGYRPLLGPFLGFGITQWVWDVGPWFYPCLGLFCNV
jgi:hypothetical protein